jgi:hypothetical protein
MKKIKWLDNFADSYAKEYSMEKTASATKVANQVIVNCTDYPNAKVGSLVDYENGKYKVVNTEFADEVGPGIILEKVADGEEGTDEGGDVEASKEVSTEDTCKASCEDESKEEEGKEEKTASTYMYVEEEIPEVSDYPNTEAIGGDKAMPSAPITGPGQKSVTDAPYHPTSDPGNSFAFDCPDDFQDAADATADAIASEDSVDRTDVKGHYTWNQNSILSRMFEDFQNEAPEEEVVVEEVVEDVPAEEVVEDVPAEEVVEDTPVEEPKEKSAKVANSILAKIISGK